LSRHARIRQQSIRLIHGPKLRHCNRVHAYDLTSAPIRTGKSNCPAQVGRTPGIAADPATGVVFANRVPAGNPRDPRSVRPLGDKVQAAIARVTGPCQRAIHSGASALGANAH
jgi:hypothetical protein